MSINELIVKNESELTEKQQEFLKLHSNIISAGVIISNGLIDLAQNLKKMKDEKLYLEAGYSSFEDYAELACGIKQRQAYNYIKILDSFDNSFLHSNAKIGITKLSLLAGLPEDSKGKLIENIDIENTSVSKLKEEIEKLKSENKAKDKLLNEKIELEAEVESLRDKISELESREPETVTVEVEKDNSAKYENELEELKQKLSDTKDKLKKKNEEVNALQFTNDSLSKQLEISNSSELVEFKLLFNNLQELILKINNILPRLPEDKQEGCKNALRKVVEELC